MASIRPASRLLTRLTTTTIRTPLTSLPTHLIRPLYATPNVPTPSSFHTSRIFSREDDNFGHTGRRQPTSAPPTDSASNPDSAPSEPQKGETLPSGIAPSKLYDFDEIQSISSSPSSYPHTILIDVREPSELLDTGRIPGARNLPIKTAPDAFFLGPDDFVDKYGFERPGEHDEVVFYCKAGVRSKAAARLAGQSGFGGKVGEFPGSMDEWIAKGGRIQRE